MITVMCFGIAAFLVLLVLGTSLPVLIVATIGLGLCMSGMYGTTVSNAGDLFSRYPASMGIYVTLNGLGAAAARQRSALPQTTAVSASALLCCSRGGDARRFRSVQHALPEKTLKSLSSRSRCRADLHRDFRFSPFINFIVG